VSTRDWQTYRDRAVVLADQFNNIHFDAELEVVESAVWFAAWRARSTRSRSTTRVLRSTIPTRC
jgi:hypothetical protein